MTLTPLLLQAKNFNSGEAQAFGKVNIFFCFVIWSILLVLPLMPSDIISMKSSFVFYSFIKFFVTVFFLYPFVHVTQEMIISQKRFYYSQVVI